jgi:hypothetical protein
VNIQAVTDKQTFNVAAALAHPAIRANARILAQIGIERPTARIPLRELESKMAAADLPTHKRLELKILLERVGLISET